MTKKELRWYVYTTEFNSKQVQKYNVFNNIKLVWFLAKAKKELKKQPEKDRESWFSEKVKSAAMNCFWSKIEYEIDITSHFPYITREEYLRIKALPDDDVRYCTGITLQVQERVDVFDQLELNWNVFVKYILDNLRLIKDVKLYG